MGRFTPRSCAARPALRVVVLTGMAVAAAAWILGTAEHRYARLSVCRTLIAGEYEKGRMFFGGGYWTDRVRRPPGAIFCSTRATAPLPSGGHYPATFSAEILCGGVAPDDWDWRGGVRRPGVPPQPGSVGRNQCRCAVLVAPMRRTSGALGHKAPKGEPRSRLLLSG